MKPFAPALIFALLGCNPPVAQPDLPPTAKPLTPVAAPPTGKLPLPKADDPVVTATNLFGYKLLQHVPADGNVMISPLSISLAVRMAMNGAAGNTLAEMQKTLSLDGIDLAKVNENSEATMTALAGDSAVEISVANSIWTRQGFPFEQSFLYLGTKSYRAKISELDFKDPGAAKVINGWVNDSTKGKIDAIVPDPLPTDAVMYLINAVYFKGRWVSPFTTSETADGAFTLADGSTVQAPMMHRDNGEGFTLDGDRVGVTMPYKDGAFEMVAILPAANEEPADLLSYLASNGLPAEPKFIPGAAKLTFPKFKASFEATLNKPLGELGMVEAFTDHADFSKMRSQRDVAISEVRHKTYIDVTEEGTEAAAVTSIGMRATLVMQKPTEIKFDRPFVYLIRHRDSGQVLFLGIVQNPKS